MQSLLEQALAHHHAGRLAEARETYREILQQNPNEPDALHLLGTLEFQEHRLDEAMELIRRALETAPEAAEFHAALAQVLFASGKIDEAIAAYRHALSLRHDMPDVHYNLGSALLRTGQFESAARSLREAINLRPDFPDAMNNLGTAFRSMGKLDESAACYQRAVALQPGDVKACVNLAQVLKMTGQLDGAIEYFDRAIALAPHMPDARSGKIYTLHYHPKCNAAQLLWENLLWNQCHAKPLRGIRRGHDIDPSPNRKLRIGYVSPDFRDHVAGLYLLPLFKAHDREKFEIYAYSNVARSDAITRQFQSHCDFWRDIAGVDDERAERMIRHDRIDILVDTTMHMGGNRLLLFARKPAPIQVTFCAYPGTTGLETMDFRMTDPYLDPPEAGDLFYSERSIRLPDSFWCYQPLDEEPMVGPLPAIANGHITFGCLNNFCKINDGVLSLWAKVLHAMANSRLLLLAPQGSAQNKVLKTLGRDGIAAGRIDFVDFQPRRQYLETYNRIDIALDTFPYNGHTTSLDAFWMGVPVITLIGQTAVGRAGWSQASNLGLTELAARDAGQFVEIAAKLALDRGRLIALRQTLRERMRKSPLMDAARFAHGVEAAYQQISSRLFFGIKSSPALQEE
ncbi:MAG TPA: tetratricopeptide repeat protein [Tepidisphaeraceae bacterium]|jgi:predicted O-linked N-acetylglucosamine transferase (SPINDLY family)|nr:tetratricopeptide repeat protein [Tepidisphaeraceae bacterium]